MLKKLFVDYSPKEMFAPNNPGIFVEMLWKAGSDVRSLVSIVSGLLGGNQWTTNPPLVGLGVCSEDRQSEETSLKQTWVQGPSQKQVCGIKITYWLSQPSPLPTPGYPAGHVGFSVFPSVFLMGFSSHLLEKFPVDFTALKSALSSCLHFPA